VLSFSSKDQGEIGTELSSRSGLGGGVANLVPMIEKVAEE